MSSGHVALRELRKTFGAVVAVDGIDLDIEGGEFFSLLGPSGCGKTTTLRLVAGFEQPTAGQILLDDRDVAHVPPHRRSVNTVFQSYALFPHLTVAENVAFGLRYQDVGKRDTDRLVGDALELVRLESFDRRNPGQLSGGQQQRVALARALVLKPRVLLLDEPLGALDAKLRKTLQGELTSLQRTVGITFLYVTHDQEEALTMSDRLAVMRGGHIEQVGPPRQVYEEPATAYVADFLGVANVLTAKTDGLGRVSLDSFTLRAVDGDAAAGGPVRIVIRPERVRLEPHGTAGENRIPGMVERLVYVGATTQLSVRLASGHSVEALVTNDGDTPWTQGSPVAAHLPAEALRILAESE